MLSKPFAISALSDPSQVRVVLYSGERFVHAPLNGVSDLLKAALHSELSVSFKRLETELQALRDEVEELKACLF
ncbi:hypothetical protein [Bartonella raoultii]|uniref:Uncharacterized protein n=1 Tax=Bartonella raoultii TaxID=1457020 RepID=A0ABS7I454_9HYPH|nr:hypothetical protein [Bartonella raoultii]MBX4335524.1 hypothetical protein [Bartonella raoultii]MBX4335618.1 hypothetical protein [Bartonella raoultii]MBX4335692.1 hypothetical protein [Bartonella raoultii]MBX4336512.1 hypothetical protein [Bartonella raoultii]